MMRAKTKKSSPEKFTVWAPLAAKVNLHIVHPWDQVIPMKKTPQGYFTKEVDAGPGSQYYYSVDGGEDIPDPASHFQPRGVRGPSQKIDHSAFEWSDVSWHGIEMRE